LLYNFWRKARLEVSGFNGFAVSGFQWLMPFQVSWAARVSMPTAFLWQMPFVLCVIQHPLFSAISPPA